jgi:methylthioribose-1-phosphate isomerase
MSGALMGGQGSAQGYDAPFAVIVGADRVACNGDTANKIGTYMLAVLARQHGVRFVVAAPRTTIDITTQSGKDIPIEVRKESEMRVVVGQEVVGTTNGVDGKVDSERRTAVSIAPAAELAVWNPAFDVTPAELIDAIVTEKGVVVKGENGKFNFSGLMNME